MDKLLFVFFQYIIPKHLLSRLVGILARSEVLFIKNNFIKLFIKLYDINIESMEPYNCIIEGDEIGAEKVLEQVLAHMG